ncbi:MAG: hypothetical protein QOG72_1863 [Sphingomonadales bacterium]|jgi:hypothetical protein|nr:hypothetical protein [Sphingomonadales bacterium]
MHLHRLFVRASSAAFLFLAAAAPAAAADPAAVPASGEGATEAAAPAAKPAEPPKKICRTIESSANRLGAKRVCMTKDEWRHVKFD